MKSTGKRNLARFELSEEEQNQITTALETIHNIVKDKTVVLSKAERQALPTMRDKRYSFVLKCLEYAKSNPVFVPNYLDVDDFELDVNTIQTLPQILTKMKQLYSQLDDTYLESGSEAYQSALVFYNSVKNAKHHERDTAKTIFKDLSSLFKGQGIKKEKENPGEAAENPGNEPENLD